MFFTIRENGVITDETKKYAGYLSSDNVIFILEEFYEGAKHFFDDFGLEIETITQEELENYLGNSL